MKSAVIKRSVNIAGHRTSISLEDEFWNSLREIADKRGEALRQLIAGVDAERKSANLSSNLRLFVLGYYRDQLNRGIKPADLRSFDQASLGLG